MDKTRTMNNLAAWIAALALCLTAGWAMAHDHDHDHGSSAPAQLTLKDGKKWPTDATLRQGMERIRAAHGAQLAPAQLSAQVDEQIAYLVSNCKLDQETDAMLHLVLADLIAGADILREKPADREKGMARISKALQDYAGHFEHPGWQ